MPRISIDVTPEQHKSIKAIAALQGQSIKDYILEQSLIRDDKNDWTQDEKKALKELEAFLGPRIEAARRGEVYDVNPVQIFEDVLDE